MPLCTIHKTPLSRFSGLLWIALGLVYFSVRIAEATTISIVNSADAPVSGAKVVIIDTETGKTRELETNAAGEIETPLAEGVEATVFVAHPQHHGWKKTSDTFGDKLVVRLQADEKAGSHIFDKMPETLPDLAGTLTIIVDQRGQLFLFSDHLVLNGKSQHLLPWRLKRKLNVADSGGNKGVLTVLAVEGGVALIELTVNKKPPANAGKKSDASFLVVDRKGSPVADATVALVNVRTKTHVKAKTNALGEAEFNDFPNEPVVVLCGHPDFRGFRDLLRSPFGERRITLNRSDGIGSVVFPRRTGHIPGLEGRLNPILDSLGRYYMYATNISLEGGKQQPVYFTIGRSIRAIDSRGTRCLINVSELIGDTSLLEYRFP